MADEKKDEKGKEGEEGGEAAAAPPAKSKKKLFIILGAALLFIVIGVPVAIFTFKDKTPKGMDQAAEDAAAQKGVGLVAEGSDDEEELGEGEEPLGAIFPLDTFVVNLTGGKFLRLQAQLEFVERDVPKRFYARLVPVRDAIIALLTARAADDLTNSQGKDTLKRELRELVNELLKHEDVKNVYFTQFVVQ